MPKYEITTYLLDKCRKLHPDLSTLELIEYYREKSKDVPLIDTDEARTAFAMREEVYGQGWHKNEPLFDRELWLDQPSDDALSACRRCHPSWKTNRDWEGFRGCEGCK